MSSFPPSPRREALSWKLPNVVLDAILILAHGSANPKIEPPTTATSARPGTPASANGSSSALAPRWARVLEARNTFGDKRQRTLRKLRKLRRDPERFFADAKSPLVRSFGTIVLPRHR